uniref:Ig-like domain-containing protein n=1 Tax=Haplochromis burtoni TaxID=8153 RepID=A0A3Q2W1J4_HAPBU
MIDFYVTLQLLMFLFFLLHYFYLSNKITYLNKEISPSQPLIVVAGDDVVLPCQLEPPVDAVQMTIEWGKPDLNPGFVFVRHNGQELQTDQNTAYKGRVSLSIDKLKHGDVSLKLSKVKVSDSGRYRCYIPQQSKEYFVELLVGK